MAEASEKDLFVCPGTRVNLNCSVENPGSSIQWSIWCDCGVERNELRRDQTCTLCGMPTTIVNTNDNFHHGNVCQHSPAITYNNSFTTIIDQGDVFVSSSELGIAVPLGFQQQNTTALCINCEGQPFAYLQVLSEEKIKIGHINLPICIPVGVPSPPKNLTFHPDYYTTNEEVVVNFTWASETSNNNEDLLVEYTITIAAIDEPVNATTGYTSTTNFTATLELNVTYSITLYASRCNHSLTSNPFVTTIIIVEGMMYMFQKMT